MIQADFLTASSREDVLTDRRWNKELRDAIVSLFCDTVQTIFRTNENLKYTWLCYLPNDIQGSFFKDIEDSIIRNLKTTRVFYSSSNTLESSSNIRHVPQAFQNADGKPLIPRLYCKYWHLSSFYNLSLHGFHIKRLGVYDMSAHEFLLGLVDMGNKLSLQTKDWLNRACNILREQFRKWNSRGYYWEYHTEIKKLPLIPLIGGVWACAVERDIFFRYEGMDVPNDLPLRFVDSNALDINSEHYTLLKNLEIKTANFSEILEEILKLHDDIIAGKCSRDLTTLIRHVKFAFNHRDQIEERLLHRLVLFDCDRNLSRGNCLYMDSSSDLPLSAVLRLPAKFIHPDYLKVDRNYDIWRQWLHSALGVSTAPRLDNGRLSLEFRNFFSDNKTEIWLKYLRRYWPEIVRNAEKGRQSGFTKEISDMVVDIQFASISSTGRHCKLNETYLRTKALSSVPGLPYLPISDADSTDWLFLKQLGVGFEMDARIIVHRLLDIKKNANLDVDIDTINGIYKQLDARFNDDNGAHIEWIRYLLIYIIRF